MNPIREIPEDIVAWAADVRRRLHADPELSFEEHRTAALVAEELAKTGAEIRTGVARTGVVARFVRSSDTPTVALRADMDALPIREQTGLSYASRNEGVMHACGHDGHTAVLLGVARMLHRFRSELRGNVILIFQPAEENGGGGQKMVEAGVLDDPLVLAAAALHAWPVLDVGQVGVGSGPTLASTDTFRIVVRGPGGHGAHPDMSVDTILAAARIVEGLHTIVSREVDPVDAGVVSVGRLHGGTAGNVIPEEVEMAGTIRALRPETRRFLGQRVREIAEGTASTLRARAEVVLQEGYPVTYNHPGLARRFQEVASAALGPDRVVRLDRPSMGGEDFSYYGERVPALMFRLGVRPPGTPGSPSLHTPEFDFADEAIPTGILALLNFALSLHADPSAAREPHEAPRSER